MNKHKYNKTNQPLTPPLNLHFIQGRRSRALAQALPALNKERNRTSQKNAFTIIEVVLVLAIAGLIFLMVFIALPALQRNQRDAQRKNDMAAFLNAYERCRSNNKGVCYSAGGDMGTFNRLVNSGYINTSEYKDPSSGEFYRVRGTSCTIYCGDGWQNVKVGQVIVDSGGGCDENGMYDYYLGPKSQATFVFLTRLEGGGYVCASNENL